MILASQRQDFTIRNAIVFMDNAWNKETHQGNLHILLFLMHDFITLSDATSYDKHFSSPEPLGWWVSL